MAAAAVALAYALLLLVASPAAANTEVDALSALRGSLQDPNGALESWDPQLVNPCTWFHVSCDNDNRVTRLDIANYNLSGELVPDLGNLDHLQYLELFKNNIQGTIPSELGNLTNLISLDLYENNISGEIPPTLGNLKSLKFLRLNSNHLTGYVPKEVLELPNLAVFDFKNNNLSGPMSSSGPFERIPLSKVEKNPRLEGPDIREEPVGDTNF